MQRIRRGWPLRHALLADAARPSYSWRNAQARCFHYRILPQEPLPFTSCHWLLPHPRAVNPMLLSQIDKLHSLSSKRLSTLVVTTDAKAEASISQHGSAALAPTLTVTQTLRHYSQCYWELSKARLSMLVVTTAGAGFVMGSGTAIDYCGLAWTCMGTFFVAAAANTFNQILEVKNDSQMKRTSRRPLPSGRISSEHAMAWAATTGVGGVALLASQANVIAAGLGAINLVLYTLVYTPLKQVHPINTWVGAVVGAVPPLLGWAAAAGEVSMGAWLLASALYFWQIPHFMAIAYLCRQDYAAGGFKMLSMLDESGKRTALAAVRNCAYLLPLGFLAHQYGMTSHWFGWETAVLSTGMGASAALFYHQPTRERARILFRASLLYLPVLLSAILLHRLPNEHNVKIDREQLVAEIPDMEAGVFDRKGATVMQGLNDGPKRPSVPPVAFFSVAPFPFLPVPVYRPD